MDPLLALAPVLGFERDLSTDMEIGASIGAQVRVGLIVKSIDVARMVGSILGSQRFSEPGSGFIVLKKCCGG
ncbi:hypothetical protein Nepgr_032595 [Nepenthes gracilis]|uniref:Uncharacterized protein n=1 Tax=Nepenthes gracilis TaxID=150966 RepID=A0AAD3TL51_NEPGR|nr:hypothetical protein Nepgr_032595 [Nepenthes gracilis]